MHAARVGISCGLVGTAACAPADSQPTAAEVTSSRLEHEPADDRGLERLRDWSSITVSLRFELGGAGNPTLVERLRTITYLYRVIVSP